jgi:hypothetical protein
VHGVPGEIGAQTRIIACTAGLVLAGINGHDVDAFGADENWQCIRNRTRGFSRLVLGDQDNFAHGRTVPGKRAIRMGRPAAGTTVSISPRKKPKSDSFRSAWPTTARSDVRAMTITSSRPGPAGTLQTISATLAAA